MLAKAIVRVAPALGVLLGLFAATAAESESPLSELLRSPKGFRLEMSLSETSASSAVISFGELTSERWIPRRARRLYRQALKLDRKGKTQLAMDKLNTALEVAPDYFQAHAALAVGYLKTGLPEEAEHHLGIARRINGDYLPAREIHALILFARGQFQDAARSFECLLRLAPARKSAHYFLGRTLLRLGDESGANHHLDRAKVLQDRERWNSSWGLHDDPFSSFERPGSDVTVHPHFR